MGRSELPIGREGSGCGQLRRGLVADAQNEM
jgi:hypothetical protein